MESLERTSAGQHGRAIGRRAIAAFSFADAIIATYLTALWTIVLRVRPTPALLRSTREIEGLFFLLVAGCVLGRATTAWSPAVRSAGYRLVSVGVLLASYLMLRDLLPALRPYDLDDSLLRADIRLLGFEPAVVLEPVSSPAVVEYFSFFYFSYFAICLAFAAVVIGRNRNASMTSEFAIGSTLVYCIGQLGYVAVPARGPIHHLAFHAPLEGGFFHRCVMDTVQAGSAMKDVFPSLHTAAPVWFAAFAWRHAPRGGRVSIAIAVITTFFAANIVASTIVLRWHYVVDVLAGLALAAFAATVAPRLERLERTIRNRAGLSGAWAFDAKSS